MAKKSKYRKTEKITGEPLKERLPEPAATIGENKEPLFSTVGKNIWFIAGLVIMAAAIFLRLYHLELKPFHNDEGVNGLFLLNLFRNGVYKYDPANYHGPTLYYFVLASSKLFGLNDFAVRFVPALFGVSIIALTFSLRRYLGTIGTLAAAALLALSPGLVFISRYFIHEIPFLFFTFGVVVCTVKFLEKEKPGWFTAAALFSLLLVCWLPVSRQVPAIIGGGETLQTILSVILFISGAVAALEITRRLLAWNNGSPIYVLLAAGCAALAFATKETAFISFGTMLIALGVIWGWFRLTGGDDEIKTRRRLLLISLTALIVFLTFFEKELKETLNWFQNPYIVNADRREQPMVLLGIAALIAGGIACLTAYFFTAEKGDLKIDSINEPLVFNRKTWSAKIGTSPTLLFVSTAAFLVFAVVVIVFFSSFLTYRNGVGAAFEAYNIWTKTGTQTHTQSGFLAYFKWGFAAESPIFILGAVGALIAFWKTKHRLAMFFALWAYGLLAAYTIIPYKTPWLAVNFILPMALIGGYGINELASGRKIWQKYAAAALTLLAFSLAFYQTIELNFYRYDDDARPYVYVHTKRNYFQMIEAIEDVSEESEAGKNIKITITSPDYFPLPWTLRDYTQTLYFGKVVDDAADSHIIIASTVQIAEIEKKYSVTHESIGMCTLRPGTDVILYKRKAF